MHIELNLTKQGQQNLKKRKQQVQQLCVALSLSLKQKNQILETIKFNDVDTNQNTPQQIQKSQQCSSTSSNKKQIFFKFPSYTDHHRHILAHKSGGLTCDDPKQIDKLRSVGKEMIKIIGRKLLGGQFNLTKISIPLKSCYPKTALFNSVKGYSIFPYFMNDAANVKDPIERFKLIVACLIAQPYYLNMFLKPLNPILGQTLQATLCDGTEIYAQQISHHPPISYFLIVGPGNSYKFYGYYDVQVQPGVNSLTIKNRGKRTFLFNDGCQIQTSYATNQFSSTFFGTSRIQQINNFVIEDKTNKISSKVQFGKVKGKPSDYFQSKICQNDKVIANIQGTCVGYLNVDGKRYWDGRELENLEIQFLPKQKRLPSDWEFRDDLQALINNDLENGQRHKERLQEEQRKDAKLRKKYRKNQQ